MACVVAALIVTGMYNSACWIYGVLPLERPFAAITENARQAIEKLGYEKDAVATAATSDQACAAAGAIRTGISGSHGPSTNTTNRPAIDARATCTWACSPW